MVRWAAVSHSYGATTGGLTRPQTVDSNSAYFAKLCFSLGINLKRIEVIADDESEIIEAVRRMSDKYDFVVTSGGIGPTYTPLTRRSSRILR